MIPNAEHWRVALWEAQPLQHAIMGYLPGFATPRIVCDVPYRRQAVGTPGRRVRPRTRHLLLDQELPHRHRGRGPRRPHRTYEYYDPIRRSQLPDRPGGGATRESTAVPMRPRRCSPGGGRSRTRGLRGGEHPRHRALPAGRSRPCSSTRRRPRRVGTPRACTRSSNGRPTRHLMRPRSCAAAAGSPTPSSTLRRTGWLAVFACQVPARERSSGYSRAGRSFRSSASSRASSRRCLRPDRPRESADRVRHIAAELDLRLCLTDTDLYPRAAEMLGADRVFPIDDPARRTDIPSSRMTHTESGVSPTDLAYVIYTSGSTGRPEGVMTEHRHVSLFVDAFNKVCGTGYDDRVYQGFSLSFDGSVEEIWMAFSNGSTLVVPTPMHRGSVTSSASTSAAWGSRTSPRFRPCWPQWRLLSRACGPWCSAARSAPRSW